MKIIIKNVLIVVSSLLTISCTKAQDVNIVNNDEGEPVVVDKPLKEAAAFPIGTAISPSPFYGDVKYREVVLRDFNSVTFEWHMKHGAIQKMDGSLDFTAADNLITALNGMTVFGHTLAWHQNQNATYLNNRVGQSNNIAGEELLSDGTFEDGNATEWEIWNNADDAALVEVINNPTYVSQGSYALKIVNPVNGNPWNVQLASNPFVTKSGTTYRVTYNIRTETGVGKVRMSTNVSSGEPAYQSDINVNTSYQTIVWNFNGEDANTRLMIDIGSTQGTYYIDNISVVEVAPPPTGPELVQLVSDILESYIKETVNHFKDRIHAWDVVNEMFTEDGRIRNSANTTIPQGANDYFIWSNYLGRDFAYKAFKYAEEADPTAELYINDYNLESSPRKLDSLIAHVSEIKQRGAKVDGIGTQMHISWKTDLILMEDMFRKLGQTGLKIRVSELDIKTVLGSADGTPKELLNNYQAAMAKKVVELYLKHIPAPQRAGITIWGVNDGNSWLSDGGKEFALFYDDNYQKKPAYAAFLAGLEGK